MEPIIDELGRIVIPREIRKELNYEMGERLTITIQDNKIILCKKTNNN